MPKEGPLIKKHGSSVKSQHERTSMHRTAVRLTLLHATPLQRYTAVYKKSPSAKFMPRPRGRPCLVALHALRLNQEKKCWHLILRNYPTVLAPKRIGLAGRPASASLSRPSHCRAMIARGHCASSVMLIKCTHAHAHL